MNTALGLGKLSFACARSWIEETDNCKTDSSPLAKQQGMSRRQTAPLTNPDRSRGVDLVMFKDTLAFSLLGMA